MIWRLMQKAWAKDPDNPDSRQDRGAAIAILAIVTGFADVLLLNASTILNVNPAAAPFVGELGLVGFLAPVAIILLILGVI